MNNISIKLIIYHDHEEEINALNSLEMLAVNGSSRGLIDVSWNKKGQSVMTEDLDFFEYGYTCRTELDADKVLFNCRRKTLMQINEMGLTSFSPSMYDVHDPDSCDDPIDCYVREVRFIDNKTDKAIIFIAEKEEEQDNA